MLIGIGLTSYGNNQRWSCYERVASKVPARLYIMSTNELNGPCCQMEHLKDNESISKAPENDQVRNMKDDDAQMNREVSKLRISILYNV